ncbi:putative peptide ABC transporter, permease protein [Devosia sp. LC5]|uniref:ABC transporter permease n=1 Tax=Devosia sp. LC5 TaxID=1502724 RepID=UPI0004E3E83A|nr:ABC transporter permease [Devosia sp. LC5]KFC71748.1 putative peptide ABC transporter, permease protein [Devosia sp. LC5]
MTMSKDIDPIVMAVPAAPLSKRRKGSLAWLLNVRLAIGLAILLIMGLGSLILPFFATVDPSIQSSFMRNMPPSAAHWLGTNSLGQDIFWFLVFAIRNSLALGVLVACGVTLVATIVGLSAGYIGGRFERFVMLIVDTFITIPLLPILIILGALIRGNTSFFTVGIIIIIFGWAWDARTVRSMALSLREREFINMARFSGANTMQIIAREIFPYVSAYMVVGFINVVLFAINTEATLAVIGLSKVEVPTLGSIIFWALNYNALFTGQYVWLVAPIIATVTLFLGLFLTSTGFNQAFASKRGVS